MLTRTEPPAKIEVKEKMTLQCSYNCVYVHTDMEYNTSSSGHMVFPKKLTLAGTVQSRMEYKRELYMTHPLDPSIPLSHTGELLTTALLGKQL